LEAVEIERDCLADQRLDLLLGVADHADAREIRATGAPSDNTLALRKHADVSLRAIWHNMVVARRQTLIQLDDARLAALDERAAASGRSRSDLVREAIDLLLGTGDAAAIDAAIVEGYARAPAPERDPWAFEGALAAIKAEPW
jgi:predicted transcriptional regulator